MLYSRDMLAFLSYSLAGFGSSLIQFVAGCALALPIYRLAKAGRIRAGIGNASGLAAFAGTLSASGLGVLLPLGLWGAAPMAAFALAAGLDLALAVPFLCANALFNSLVPFTDPTFIWRTGYGRIILALAAGSLGGLLALRARPCETSVFRPRPRSALPAIAASLACLAAGALADTAFRRYALGAVIGFLYASPATAFLPAFFARRNVENPFFLLAMRILATLTDFSALAALALILKPKGMLYYFAYFAAITAILSLSAFF